MGLILQLLVGGEIVLDLGAPTGTYFVHSGTLVGFGEPEVDAKYVEEQLRHGSRLSDRRFRNRQIEFQLAIAVQSGGVNAREVARNALADVIDQARRYGLMDPPGTTVSDGEVLLKYRAHNATECFYTRVLDGALGTSQVMSGGGGRGTLAGRALDALIPITLVTNPFWTLERDPHLTNCLVNADFEVGTLGSTATGWSDVTITGTPTSANGVLTTAYARTGGKAFRLRVSAGNAFTLGSGGGASLLGGSDVLGSSTGGAGAIQIWQSVTAEDVGIAAGDTVRLKASLYLDRAFTTGAAATVAILFYDVSNNVLLSAESASVIAQGEGVAQIVADVPPDTAYINCFLKLAVTTGTATAYFDDALLDDHNHGHQLLSGGDFGNDTPSDTGLSLYWLSEDGGRTATSLTRPSDPKFEGVCQSVAAIGSGEHALYQDVLLSDTPLRAGDLATFGAWAKIVSGAIAGEVRISFYDIGGDELDTATSAYSTATTYTWVGVSCRVPLNTYKIRCRLIDTGSGSATIHWDWAVLYPGHHDGSAGRFWPTPEWIGSSLLTGDPAATDGTEITISHADFRGNVPAPVQLLVAPDDEVPHPLIVGYKRESTRFLPFANTDDATALTADVLGPAADSAAIGATARRWYPASTGETALLSWDGSDTPPGRYLIVLRAQVLSADAIDKFAFRAAVRVADGSSAAGTWNLDLHPAPNWLTQTPGYHLWPLGSLPLPLLQRLPRYVGAIRFELWGRCTSPGGGVGIDLDGLYFVPLDGYYRSLSSPLSRRPTGFGYSPYYQVTIDGITPTPGGLYSNTGGDKVLTLPATVADRPDAQDDGIAVGESGRFVVMSSGLVHDKTDKIRVALRYRAAFTTAGGGS